MAPAAAFVVLVALGLVVALLGLTAALQGEDGATETTEKRGKVGKPQKVKVVTLESQV